MISARMTTPAAPSGSPPSGTPGPARGAAAYVLPLYALTLFLSAFLLFAVQPMFTKMVLPLLGGSAAVWNTAVVFFQGTLLCGYFYAHLSTRLLGLRRQTILHALVLLSAFLVLPIGVAKGWEPPTVERQIPWLIGLLAVSIGLPFFAVSVTPRPATPISCTAAATWARWRRCSPIHSWSSRPSGCGRRAWPGRTGTRPSWRRS